MLENNSTGFEKRIATEFPTLSRGQVKKAAKKIKHIMDNMTEVRDFYEGLRIMGMITDTTARDAVRNLEAAA